MTVAAAKELHSGDQVFWNDPDGGLCSRYYTIESIELFDDEMVRIYDVDGDVLECFARELS